MARTGKIYFYFRFYYLTIIKIRDGLRFIKCVHYSFTVHVVVFDL